MLPAVSRNKSSVKLWDDSSENFQEIDTREEAEKESVANWNICQSLSNKVLGAKEVRTALKTT